MDGRSPGIGQRGRTLGVLALTVLLWPLGGHGNIPRIPFQELPRDEIQELPFAQRWHAARSAEADGERIELARVPPGTVRVPAPPARLGD